MAKKVSPFEPGMFGPGLTELVSAVSDGSSGTGSTEYCVCTSCGHYEKYSKDKPCQEKKCPECELPLKGVFFREIKLELEDMTPDNLAKEPDSELLAAHLRLHQWWILMEQGAEFNKENLINAHIFVWKEMKKRSIDHNMVSELDKQSMALMSKIVDSELYKRLEEMEDFVIRPDYISLVGSAVDKENPFDKDILIRDFKDDPANESLLIAFAKKWGRTEDFHPDFEIGGPHDDYIPLYDLVARKKPTIEIVRIKYYQPAERKDKWLRFDSDLLLAKMKYDEDLKIDLGCGAKAPAGYLGIDIRAGYGDITYDLENGLPMSCDRASEIRAWHFLEHIENTKMLISEIWHVLRPDGVFVFEVPSTKGQGAFANPDHKSFWNKLSFMFFVQDDLRASIGIDAKFEIVELEEYKNEEWDTVYVRGILKAIKPEGGCQCLTATRSKTIGKRLAPFGSFVPPKPTMAFFTEFFSAEEMWDKWGAERIEKGIDLEEKLNGFRAVFQKKGDRTDVKFEETGKSRSKQLSDLIDVLKTIPDDFILDTNVGINRKGAPLPRISLMTLVADEPELGPDDVIVATIFDMPYWEKDLHKLPLSERREKLQEFYKRYLSKSKYFALTHYSEAKSKIVFLRTAKRVAHIAGSEGCVAKTLDSIWDISGSTGEWAKTKTVLELKVIVLKRIVNKGGSFNYQCGVLLGDAKYTNTMDMDGKTYVDLGKTFNTKISGQVGDIITVYVHEIIDQEETLAWLGPTVLDLDKSRSTPYAALQVVDLAKRAGSPYQGVKTGPLWRDLAPDEYKAFEDFLGEELEEAFFLEDPVGFFLQLKADFPDYEYKADEEGGSAGEGFWRENWQEMFPPSGKGEFTYQHHWGGLDEEESKLSEDGLLDTAHSIHGDLRHTARGDYLWGFSVFLGKAADVKKAGGDKLSTLPFDDKLQGTFKLAQPKEWLTLARRAPNIRKPGTAGTSEISYAKLFEIDHGSYEVGVWREHAFENFYHGKKIDGKFIIGFVPIGGARKWLIGKPTDQTPYAVSRKKEDIIAELAGKGQQWLVWSEPGSKPVKIDVTKEVKKALEVKIKTEGFSIFKTIRGKDGRDYWVSISGSAFLDREKEIISQAALDYAIRYHDSTGIRGPLRIYHFEETDAGECLISLRVRNFLVEAGYWYDDDVSKAAKEWSEKEDSDPGISVGFFFDPEKFIAGIYKQVIIFERSLVRVMDAACPWTLLESIKEGKVMGTKEQLAAIIGDENAERIVARAETKSKVLEEEGVAYKTAGKKGVGKAETDNPVASIEEKATELESEVKPDEEKVEAKAETEDEGKAKPEEGYDEEGCKITPALLKRLQAALSELSDIVKEVAAYGYAAPKAEEEPKKPEEEYEKPKTTKGDEFALTDESVKVLATIITESLTPQLEQLSGLSTAVEGLAAKVAELEKPIGEKVKEELSKQPKLVVRRASREVATGTPLVDVPDLGKIDYENETPEQRNKRLSLFYEQRQRKPELELGE